MKTYLAVLKSDADPEEFRKFLNLKKIKILDYYKALQVFKIQSNKKLNPKDFKKFCESIEEDRDDLTI
ncbi:MULTISPECIES: hypothetical protein [Chryseobacterium]|uniref:Uncharacterized protein n=1 Tax=Chryseobacterium taihuense TaxID=1141221 RepID=A0A4U8WDB7_9FLAO|nr:MULTISPECIES: hypothetical protein [Chryseobacterium]QQV03124.1 hypothetical protein I6I61_01835 [Chryseobacterium sp. FDAARGOS 1104]VFB03576.1 Uncharacterised protein [Chryseobacterium taihuense]